METVTGGVNCHYQTACLPSSGKARGVPTRPYLKSVRIGTARCARCEYHSCYAESFAAAASCPGDALREKENEEIAICGHVVTTSANRWVLRHPSSRPSRTPGTSGRSRRGPVMPGGPASLYRPRRTCELRQRLNICRGLAEHLDGFVSN